MFAQVMHYERMINYELAVAPYRQVAAILRERIDAGRYAPGTRLPSINDLVEESAWPGPRQARPCACW